ncbi:hypothetical protein [Tateyamaria sp. SN6-1]|uniref:hypothetical protein n=1 Tax=Tateyamaria sp. SN6-1 TaxID=3092148 RepID=UPI0039F616E8
MDNTQPIVEVSAGEQARTYRQNCAYIHVIKGFQQGFAQFAPQRPVSALETINLNHRFHHPALTAAGSVHNLVSIPDLARNWCTKMLTDATFSESFTRLSPHLCPKTGPFRHNLAVSSAGQFPLRHPFSKRWRDFTSSNGSLSIAGCLRHGPDPYPAEMRRSLGSGGARLAITPIIRRAGPQFNRLVS